MKDLSVETLQMRFLDHLRIARGNVADACKSMQLNRDLYLQWLNEDQGFRFQVMVMIEEIGDWVEQQLIRKIGDGDTQAIMFYCKTKLKHRGYVEDVKQAPVAASKTKINVIVNGNKDINVEHAEVIDENT
jgi:hypothetical protein